MHRPRRERDSVFCRSVVPGLAAALSLLPPFPVSAAQFGELEVGSPLGGPLRASLSVRPDAGETLGEQCLRVASPVGSGPPAIPGVRISVSAISSGSVRLEISAASVAEPAMRFALAADCGAGMSLREYVVLASPVLPTIPSASRDNGTTWVLRPDETPAGLARTLFPSQPALQRRLVTVIGELNPMLSIGDGTAALPAGTALVMPDWKHFAVADASPVRASLPAVSPRRIPRHEESATRTDPVAAPLRRVREPAPQEMRFFRMTSTLAVPPVVDERLREILRLEYRLLIALEEQLALTRPAMPTGVAYGGGDVGSSRHGAGQGSDVAVLRIDPAPEMYRPAAASASSDSAVLSVIDQKHTSRDRSYGNSLSAPAVPSAPPVGTPAGVVASSAGAPAGQTAFPEGTTADDRTLPYIAAVVGILLLTALLLARRRRQAAGSMPSASEIYGGETLVLDHPPAVPRASASTTAGDDFAGDSVPVVAAVPVSALEEGEQAAAGANPVMELAEIMLSFGRLQGAVQTLQEYIEANPREALQPWIKLLEIYREGGMRSEYEALAARLNGTYNVEIQRWDADAPADKTRKPVGDRGQEFSRVFSLEEVPHVRDRLVAEWGKPACLDYLHHLLRDNRNGRRNGFTLPVIQEILFLIDILVMREAS